MDRAAARLAEAVMADQTIAVFGDYDVDGATSAALLQRFLAAVGARTLVHIPDRAREGYGPNAPALLTLGEQGARVIVTVDCGVSAFDPLARAAEAGLEVIVVDHHIAEARLPQAYAVINPNRLDESSPHRQLAAVGVTFLLVVAVNRRLRQLGRYQGRPEPDLLQWLDLVALGTVCDVVPLTGLNRPLVTQGLKVIAGRGNLGLAALADVAGLDARPGTYHAGFILGPRINAGGRVGESNLGVRLLTTGDADEAASLAARLDMLNKQRQAIEAEMLDAALTQVEGRDASGSPMILAAGAGWHEGVIGIIASRLKERYDRPALVAAFKDGVGKASCRSIPGVDVGGAVTAARQAGLLINGGGHPMAAGLTVEEDKFPALGQFLLERLAPDVARATETASLGCDGALATEGATHELVETLERLAPFGAGNAEPRFALSNARIVRADVVGRGHVRCILAGATGGRLKAIAFRSVDAPLGHALLAGQDSLMHLAGHLRLDRWRDREDVQLVIHDAAHPS
jgi:single-stranded-DNA-specific exonuclease